MYLFLKNIFEYVIKGMERAVEGINGTAKKSRITNLKICGKTGTVENYKKNKTKRSISIYSTPKNPEIAIAVYIENGGDGGDEGLIANL